MTIMSLKVSRILHAGYSFECESTQILFDPIFETPFSRNCYPFPNVSFDTAQIRQLKIDAVFISHFHDDHCSMVSLNLLARTTPIYIFCIHDEMLSLIRSLGFQNIISLRLGKSIPIGPITVTPYPALDVDVDSIFHIQAAGVNVLNVVDSWIGEDTLNKLKSRGSWDLVLWPFQTMREIEVLSPSRFMNQPALLPPEWLAQIHELNPKMIVPSSCQFIHESWSWYNHAFFPITYAQFENEIKSILPATDVQRLNPGVSLTVNSQYVHRSSPLPWIKPIGNQDVDYEYRPAIPAPSTAYIATKVSGATKDEGDRVYRYCRETLPKVYGQLYEHDDDYEQGYFGQRRLWRLNLYDQLGQVRVFSYIIQGRQIVLVDNTDLDFAWITEVPVVKVFAALELGESLTSMYMRINDIPLAAGIEADLKDVDFLEDPLVRCLFNGAFGAYQKAQLKQISAER